MQHRIGSMLSFGRSALPVWQCVTPARASTSLRCQTRLLSNLATRTNDGVQYRGQTLPYLWLRDTCQCPRCVHPSTRQKLHRSTDVAPEIRPKDFEATKEGVKINWGSGHESFYPSEFLERYSSASKRHEFHKDVDRVPWDQHILTKSPSLFVSYDSLQRPDGLLKAMTQIVQYGLLFVRGVPNQETSNETCELRTLATKFGELRETFYGSLWDVINVRNSTNIAYTNLFLDLHMDLLYFQHPPRYQILHCLRNRVNGGSSVFVDALRVAESLRHPTKDLFKSLSTTPVHFHYINNGHHYHQSHPTIELDHDANVAPHEDKPIKFINYSPPFQAPLSPETDVDFYRALKEFVARLEAPGAKFEYQLREGDAVVFDNRRVLHARTAFTDKEQDEKDAKDKETDANEPNRWLKGCYLEEDALLSLRRGLIERSS